MRCLLTLVSVEVSSVCLSDVSIEAVIVDVIFGAIELLVVNLLLNRYFVVSSVVAVVVGTVFLIPKTPRNHGFTSTSAVLLTVGLASVKLGAAVGTVVFIAVDVLGLLDQSGGKNSPPNCLGSASVVVRLVKNSSLNVIGGAKEVSSVKTARSLSPPPIGCFVSKLSFGARQIKLWDYRCDSADGG